MPITKNTSDRLELEKISSKYLLEIYDYKIKVARIERIAGVVIAR